MVEFTQLVRMRVCNTFTPGAGLKTEMGWEQGPGLCLGPAALIEPEYPGCSGLEMCMGYN